MLVGVHDGDIMVMLHIRDQRFGQRLQSLFVAGEEMRSIPQAARGGQDVRHHAAFARNPACAQQGFLS